MQKDACGAFSECQSATVTFHPGNEGWDIHCVTLMFSLLCSSL